MKRDTDRQVLQTDRQTEETGDQEFGQTDRLYRQKEKDRQATKKAGRQTGIIQRRTEGDRQALYTERLRETDRQTGNQEGWQTEAL